MKPITFSVGARLDLLRDVDWYEERQAGLGERFRTAVERRLRSLHRARLRSLDVEGVTVHFCEVGRPWPYRIVVLELAEAWRVLALAHHRRDPSFWTSRLDDEP
jgi:toxin ParE1/3/4